MGLDAVMPKAMLRLYYEKRVERHEEGELMGAFGRDGYDCI